MEKTDRYLGLRHGDTLVPTVELLVHVHGLLNSVLGEPGQRKEGHQDAMRIRNEQALLSLPKMPAHVAFTHTQAEVDLLCN